MTIKDIARLAGVGVGTVSRVLNNHPDVTDKTRQKVMAVINQYNYQPNLNAKHLKQQHRSSITIIVKGTHNMLFAEIVEQIQILLQAENEESVVSYIDEDANEVAYAVQLCDMRHPKGILFLGGDLNAFRSGFGAISIPCVLLTNSAASLPFDNLSSLTTDDRAGAECAIDYLIDHGHREIGVLGGNWSCFQIGHARLQGCLDSFQRHAIPFDPSRQGAPCRYSMEDGYEVASRLLERNPNTTAFFAMSDVIAMGAIRALEDQGKHVPEDVSVIGYDGILTARYSVPRLTTIMQDSRQFAARGTELLLGQINGKTSAVHEVIPFRLLEGESVAARK